MSAAEPRTAPAQSCPRPAAAQPTPQAHGAPRTPRSSRAAAGSCARSDGPQVAVFDTTGWDTHANEGGAEGQLAGRLAALDKGLARLKTELGAVWNDTAVLLVTEFGRTAAINGTRGTDHGTGAAGVPPRRCGRRRARDRRLAGTFRARALPGARSHADARPALGAEGRARRAPLGARARARHDSVSRTARGHSPCAAWSAPEAAARPAAYCGGGCRPRPVVGFRAGGSSALRPVCRGRCRLRRGRGAPAVRHHRRILVRQVQRTFLPAAAERQQRRHEKSQDASHMYIGRRSLSASQPRTTR